MKRVFALVAALLGVAWLAAETALLLWLRAAPGDAYPILVLANVGQLAAFGALLCWLLVSNTRRPAGRDPDAPPPPANPPPDPFGQDTPALLVNGRPYGRRAGESDAVRRIIQALEGEGAPPPPWATEAMKQAADRGDLDLEPFREED